jgi:hypothetical protein
MTMGLAGDFVREPWRASRTDTVMMGDIRPVLLLLAVLLAEFIVVVVAVGEGV